MLTTFEIIKNVYLWIGQITQWLNTTEIVPGFSFIQVLMGGTVIGLGIHFIQQIFRSDGRKGNGGKKDD